MEDFRESNKLAQTFHSWLIVISFSSTVSEKYVCFNWARSEVEGFYISLKKGKKPQISKEAST